MHFILILLCLTLPSLTWASANNLNDQLQRVERKVEVKKETIERIQNQTHSANAALSRMQKQLIQTAKDIRGLERSMTQLQQREDILLSQIQQAQADLTATKGKMAVITSAAYRLGKRPAGLAFLKSGDRLENARLASLLQRTMPELQDQAVTSRDKLQQVQILQQDLQNHRRDIAAARSSLNQRRGRLDKMIKDRQALLNKGRAFINKETEELKRLSQKALSIQALLNRIAPRQSAKVKKPNFRLSKLALPVSGLIATHFGDETRFGGTSSGLNIAAGANALVTAPLSGTIRFTGDFLKYRGLVIIEHDGNYHSLLAGMKQIMVTPGQTIVSGEPIGILMGEESLQPSLYYELRQSGRPIDPHNYF